MLELSIKTLRGEYEKQMFDLSLKVSKLETKLNEVELNSESQFKELSIYKHCAKLVHLCKHKDTCEARIEFERITKQ